MCEKLNAVVHTEVRQLLLSLLTLGNCGGSQGKMVGGTGSCLSRLGWLPQLLPAFVL